MLATLINRFPSSDIPEDEARKNGALRIFGMTTKSAGMMAGRTPFADYCYLPHKLTTEPPGGTPTFRRVVSLLRYAAIARGMKLRDGIDRSSTDRAALELHAMRKQGWIS